MPTAADRLNYLKLIILIFRHYVTCVNRSHRINMKRIKIIAVCRPQYLPHYSSENASGADLKADIEKDILIRPAERIMIATGVRLQIPKGYEGQVRPRSGLAIHQGLTVLNSPGTIDSDYNGEIKAIIINLGHEDYILKKGERIAQIVFTPVVRAVFSTRKQIKKTSRGPS